MARIDVAEVLVKVKNTQDFCADCRHAMDLDDLDAMVRERDRLKAELTRRIQARRH